MDAYELADKFDFHDDDIHHFTKKLESKTSAKFGTDEVDSKDSPFGDFVDMNKETDYEEAMASIQKQGNVEDLNLFGVDLKTIETADD